MENKPLIIFDTDMDTDCDDAGALAMIYSYIKEGKAELLGIIADSAVPYTAPACEYLGNYFDIKRPIGALYASRYPESRTSRLNAYRAHSKKCAPRSYNKPLAEALGKTDRDYPAAKDTYRQLLAAAEDGSVTILAVGLLTALDELLLSKGDEISPLSGMELISRKVKRIVVMGYPESKGSNFNWDMDAPAAEHFIKHSPLPLFISGEGEKIITGRVFSEKFPKEHPLRFIYETFNSGSPSGRSSWDLIATLFALDPENEYISIKQHGKCIYDPKNQVSYFSQNTKRCDFEIIPAKSNEDTERYIDSILALTE